jgi:hypothetical protein
MSLGTEQRKFVAMIGKLIIYTYEMLGYELTFGESYDDDGVGHMKGSLHYVRLAQDFNVFKDGVFLTDGTGHKEMHDFWDSIGGAPRIEKDLNHYSLVWEGKR